MILNATKSPYYKGFLCLFNLFFMTNSLAEGFAAGTLVKTSQGYIPIEQLKVGDTVTSYNDCGFAVESKVIAVSKKQYLRYLEIVVYDECLKVAPDHKFYVDSDEKPLCKAGELEDHVRCATYNWFDNASIANIEEKEAPIELYSIGVADYHNFCVTHHNIYVHNMIPFVVGFSWTFGLGALEWAGFSVGTVLAGIGLGYIFTKDNGSGGSSHNISLSLAGVGTPMGPNGNGCRYDDASYHHGNSKGKKSPAPKDGAQALRYSVEMKGTDRRVGVSNGQFVVLDMTSYYPECVYHGHVRSWNELTGKMRNALQDAGLVNSKGKILI